MTSSGKWKVLYTDSFRRSLQDLIKRHYRKDKRGKEDFQRMLEQLVSQLQQTEFPAGPLWKGKPEPAPTRSLSEHQVLAKIYIKLPRLKGASKEGRILYLIDRRKSEIKLLHVYTHQEYAKRPPNGLIRKLLGL